MKAIYVLLIVILPCSLFAQDSTKWSLGVEAGACWSGRFSKATSDMQWAKDKYDQQESGRFAWSAGALVKYRLSSKLSISAGLSYLDLGYKSDTIASASMADVRFHFRYGAVPIAVQWNVVKSNTSNWFVQPAVVIGLQTQNAMNYRLIGDAQEKKITGSVSDSKMLTMAGLAIGWEKWVTSKDAFVLQWRSMFALNALQPQGVQRFLHTSGIYISYMRSLR
jgi:Outer membrane protein beta-barrel domain